MIHYDRTQRSVLALCTSCGARDIFTSQAAADAWALRHLEAAHPDPQLERRRAVSAAHTRTRRK